MLVAWAAARSSAEERGARFRAQVSERMRLISADLLGSGAGDEGGGGGRSCESEDERDGVVVSDRWVGSRGWRGGWGWRRGG